ncbi:MAG: hypothetical protein HQL40_07340 [Alphaproteobacteria bacterium]|nr:hypothetical protein [Alphaproteobacteria bacterium]MBF0373865.1 hypothetical protein [Alphaproteobacteria bacterium]
MKEVFSDNRTHDELLAECRLRLQSIKFVGGDNKGKRVSYVPLSDEHVSEGVNFILDLVYRSSQNEKPENVELP